MVKQKSRLGQWRLPFATNEFVCLQQTRIYFVVKVGYFTANTIVFATNEINVCFYPFFICGKRGFILRQTQLFLLQTSFPFATNEIKVCVYVLFICGKRNFILPQKSFSFTTNEIIVCRSRSSFVTNVYWVCDKRLFHSHNRHNYLW